MLAYKKVLIASEPSTTLETHGRRDSVVEFLLKCIFHRCPIDVETGLKERSSRFTMFATILGLVITSQRAYLAIIFSVVGKKKKTNLHVSRS